MIDNLVIPADSLIVDWIWLGVGPGCFALLVGGSSNPIEP